MSRAPTSENFRFKPIVHIDDALVRQRLISRMCAAPPSSARVTIVSAPAGFGKTTLLAQFAQQLRGHGVTVAWLNCDARDGHADVFTDDLVTALSTQGVRFVADPHGSNLALSIARIDGDLAIFIDDFEVASNPSVGEVIDLIAMSAPENVSLVIGTRKLPTLQLTQLQLAGRARLIEADTLRFTHEEARALLQSHLPERIVSQVALYADGWPFALQLARLAAAGGMTEGLQLNPDPRVPRRQIFDYLADEVLSSLDSEAISFLAEAAVLDVIEVDAANEVRGRADSVNFIKALMSLKPIVVVDESCWSARLHPLLRDYLMDALGAQGAGRAATLHHRAARYFAKRGDIYEAVRHAVRSGRPGTAAEMIQEAGALLLLVDQGGQRIRLLLEQLPAAAIRRHPRIRLLHLARKVLEFDGEVQAARAEFARLERLVTDEDERAELELDFSRSLMLFYEAERTLAFDPWPLVNRLNERAKSMFGEEPRFLGFAFPIEIFFLHRYGPVERAERRTRETLAIYQQAFFKYNSPWLWMYQARNSFARGELDKTHQILSESLGRDSNFINYRQNFLGKLVNVLLGRICMQRRQLHAAIGHFTSATENPVAVLEVHTALVDLAECEFDLGNEERAFELLGSAKRHALEENLVHLALVAGATHVHLALRYGEPEVAGKVAAQMQLDRLWELPRNANLPWIDVVALARAKFALCLFRGELPAALRIATSFLSLATQAGQRIGEVAALAMRARAMDAMGDAQGAQAALDSALAASGSGALLSPFFALGPEMMSQLRATVAAGSASPPAIAAAVPIVRAWEDQFRARAAHNGILTKRELDVLCALPGGRSTKEIARQLVLSPETVKHHLKSIFAKLGASSRGQAVSEARRRMLLP